MERYQNRGGNSGTVAFTITEDSITLKFKDGWHYIYNSIRPGQADVVVMKAMAKTGGGLHGFINRKIRNNYFHKYHMRNDKDRKQRC